MLPLPSSRCFAALVVVFALSSHGHAQDTYNLRGEGARQGMEYTTNLISITKSSTNGESANIMLTIKQIISVKAIDMNGNIVEAAVIPTGEVSNSANPGDNLVFGMLSNRTVICKRVRGDWVVTLEDGSQPKDMDKEMADFPCPTLQREFMPIIGVPVGHKWELNAKDYWDIYAATDHKLASMCKKLSGKVSYTFEKTEILNGVTCAFIKCTFAFKGNIKPDEDGG